MGTALARVTLPPCNQGEGITLEIMARTTETAIIRAQVVNFFVFLIVKITAFLFFKGAA